MTYATLERSTHSGKPFELYKFEWGTGSFQYTSADSARAYQGLNYQPEAISRSQLDQNNEDWSGTVDVTLPADNPVSVLFSAYQPTKQVYLTIYRAHQGDGDYTIAFSGTVSAATFSDTACTLTCQPVSAILTRPVPSAIFQPQCNRVLFSQTELYGTAVERSDSAQSVGCGVNKDAYRVPVSVTAIDGLVVTSPDFATKADGWFTYGHLELANGEVRWIVEHVGNTVTLSYPAYTLAVGDAISALPGCDGLEGTCKQKFNNIINFSGFSHVPLRNPFNTPLT